MVKTYSKKSPVSRLQQTTITQIDFLEPIDPDEMASDRQKQEGERKTTKHLEEPSRKRRRKTEGDVPDSEDGHDGTSIHPTSSYKTRTLTQHFPDFLCSGERLKEDKERVIRDSEDESDDMDRFFGAPPGGNSAKARWAGLSTKEEARSSPTAGPQTPSNTKKRRSGVLEVPSSQPSPYTPLLERYSPGPRGSPLRTRSTNVGTPMPTLSVKKSVHMASGEKKTTRKLVIQDSYASTWSISSGQLPSSSAPGKTTQDVKTAERLEDVSVTTEDSEKENRTPTDEEPEKAGEITKPRTHTIEIADSEDDDDFDGLDESLDATLMPIPVASRKEVSQILGESNERATESSTGSPSPPERNPNTLAEADGEEEETTEQKMKPETIDGEEDLYPMGAETQCAMDLIISGQEEAFNSSRPNETMQPSTSQPIQNTPGSAELPLPIAPSTSWSKTPKATPRKVKLTMTSPHVNFESEERSPAHHKTQAYTQRNSQRVDLDSINEMPEPTFRSDVFISIHPDHVRKIVNGTKNHDFRGWKAPDTVIRVWIYETKPESRLRYMARISHAKKQGEIEDDTGIGNAEFNRGEKRGKIFAYEFLELYELNNPVSYAKMKEYGWLNAVPSTFSFVPPAVVSQLQANLRCRLLDRNETQSDDQSESFGDTVPDSQTESGHPLPQNSQATSGDKTVSQQVTAQLHSDYLHSTQHHASDDHDDEIIPSSQTPTRPQKRSAGAINTIPPNRRATRSSNGFIAPQRPSSRNIMPSSQATTTSAVSTPSPHKSAPRHSDSMASLPVFHDSGSPLRVPEGNFDIRSSQLVTVSQLLPESLIRQSTQRPPVVFDSEDDGDEI